MTSLDYGGAGPSLMHSRPSCDPVIVDRLNWEPLQTPWYVFYRQRNAARRIAPSYFIQSLRRPTNPGASPCFDAYRTSLANDGCSDHLLDSRVLEVTSIRTATVADSPQNAPRALSEITTRTWYITEKSWSKPARLAVLPEARDGPWVCLSRYALRRSSLLFLITTATCPAALLLSVFDL
ncbi:hypothetical protein PGQ11_011269 [Apiospora arundinis]|uniref:Uncharacterized protein n=1 Tax=Apiospora arundinis TaxID=335852 RepID=A0ABR2HZM3_9PEZI